MMIPVKNSTCVSHILELSTSDKRIPYILYRSKRRRTVALCVTESGEVKLYVPYLFPEDRARSFIVEKSNWIIEKLAQVDYEKGLGVHRKYEDGHIFMFLGKSFHLRIQETPVAHPIVLFNGQGLLVQIPCGSVLHKKEIDIKKALLGWYREQAREIFPGRIFNYARIMGLDPQTIAVKTQRRSWGSCSYHRRSINLNWQLIMAPMEVIDYVVVHELAHLVHPNHSPRFWRKVANFMPNYKERKKWLQENRLRMILP